jgi:Mg2+ and Co2+ transporter CorA
VAFKRYIAREAEENATQYGSSRPSRIRALHSREGGLTEMQNRENTSALLELRDIEEELYTLKTLFDDQMKVIVHMRDEYQREKRTTGWGENGRSFLRQAHKNLQEYMDHLEKMIESVRNTRDDVRYRRNSWDSNC